MLLLLTCFRLPWLFLAIASAIGHNIVADVLVRIVFASDIAVLAVTVTEVVGVAVVFTFAVVIYYSSASSVHHCCYWYHCIAITGGSISKMLKMIWNFSITLLSSVLMQFLLLLLAIPL